VSTNDGGPGAWNPTATLAPPRRATRLATAGRKTNTHGYRHPIIDFPGRLFPLPPKAAAGNFLDRFSPTSGMRFNTGLPFDIAAPICTPRVIDVSWNHWIGKVTMSRRWNFSVLQLLLLTALCGLCAGVVATSRKTVPDALLENLVFSEEGRWLAAGYLGGEVRVWDLERRRLWARIRASSPDSASLDFHGARFIDQDTLALLRRERGSAGAELVLWDVRQNRESRAIEIPPGPERYAIAPASGLAGVFYPSDSRMENATDRIELRKLSTGEIHRVLEVEPMPSRSYCWQFLMSSDGSTILASFWSLDAKGDIRAHVRIWDTVSGSPRVTDALTLNGPLDMSSDGKKLAVIRSDQVVVWDIEANRESIALRRLTGESLTARFTADGQRLLTWSAPGEVQVWDLASGQVVGSLSGADLTEPVDANAAFISPDGRWIATWSYTRISLWDAQTFAHVRDLYRDRRFEACFAYSLALVGWAAVWGWVARRRRPLPQDRPRLEEPSVRPVPLAVRAALNPYATWAWLLLPAVGIAVALVWLSAGWRPRQWSHPANFVAVVWVSIFTCAYGFVGGVLALAMLRRWRGVAYLAGIARAERVSGVTGQRERLGPVTACFLGRTQVASSFAEDFEYVRQRFESLFGTAVELRRPLTVLVFERVEWYEWYLRYHLPIAGMYCTDIDRQILLCEDLCLPEMTEPRWLWRQLLARYFFEQHRGFTPESGLAGILGASLLFGLDPCLGHREHRKLQAMLRRGEPVGTLESLHLTDRQLLAAVVNKHHREPFLVIDRFSSQCGSLAEYLLGDAAGDRAERFQSLLRQCRRKEPLAELLPRHLGTDAAEFEHAWRRWILDYPTGPAGYAAAPIERYIQDRMLPLIVNRQASLEQRAIAIRRLGSAGFERGIDSLIDVLNDADAAPLHPDAVWALESISGQNHGNDPTTWQRWWAERRSQIDDQRPALDAGEPEIFLAQLADDDSQPLAAELADQVAETAPGIEAVRSPESSGTVESSESSGEKADWLVPPRRLKVLRGLLWVGGFVAVVWSVSVTLLLGDLFWYVSVLGILAGTYAMTRYTGTETRGLFAAAQLLTLNLMLANLPSCLIGLIATWQYRHPRVREYLRSFSD
jgi:WD40 repeat protein